MAAKLPIPTKKVTKSPSKVRTNSKVVSKSLVPITKIEVPVAEEVTEILSSPSPVLPIENPDWIAEHPREYEAFSPNKKAFLTAYAATMRVNKAAQAANVSTQAHTNWIHEDTNYRAAFQSARRAAVQILEDEAVRRAVEGVEKDIFYRTTKIGTEIKYSDSLMETLLLANDPRYRKNQGFGIRDANGGLVATVALFDELLKDN